MDSIEGIRMSMGHIFNNTIREYNFGSPLTTMIISSLVIMLFNTFLAKIMRGMEDFKYFITSFLKDNFTLIFWNEIELQGTISINKYSAMNNNFDRFMMIINGIIENTDKIEKIKKLKEEEMKKMDNDDSYNSTEMNLIINHNNFLRIDAENDIWVRFYSFDKEDEGGKDKKSVIQSVRKITISIRSKKLSVTKLKKYIDNETQKYIEKIDEKI